MSDRRKGTDVLVVGGGAIGCVSALALAREGRSVTVVERSPPEAGATWAAAGMLSPLGEAEDPGPFLRLGRASLDLYPGLVEDLEEYGSRDLLFEWTGSLHVAFDDEGVGSLRSRHRWQRDRGHRTRWLEGEELAEAEAGLAPGVRAGLLIDEDAQVDNRFLGEALRAAAARAGARMIEGLGVREVLREARRVRGAQLSDGSVVAAEAVVVAAGCWSGRLAGLPRTLPVRPVRGQMVALGPVDRPERPGFILVSPDCYLVPRADGRILVGATVEEAGYDARTTVEGVSRLLAGAVRAYPSVADAPVLETWAGLRPGTPDELPILGQDPELEGLVYATGHFRNGILLAPITGGIVAALVDGRPPPVDIEAFRPDRFGGEGVG